MSSAILEKLKAVIYPELDKNIVELKLVDSVEVEDSRVVITLAINNESNFPIIEARIKDILQAQFSQIEVKLKAQKKSLTFGSTQNPNNRAKFAKKVIAVTSGKGGVGKSTVSTNLAVALAQKGFKVGLLDADVYGPDIPRMFQVEHEKLRWNDNDKIEPSENFGVKLMSVGLTTPSSDTALVWRSSVAISALMQFLEDVEWGELDFLVIDMPPGTGDVQLSMAEELHISAGVLVTTPQQVSSDDVSRAIMMFKDIGIKIGGIVENMSYFIAPDTKKRYEIFGKGAGETLAKKYSIPFLGKIPLDMQIREFSDSGTPAIALGDRVQKGYYKNIVQNLLKELEA